MRQGSEATLLDGPIEPYGSGAPDCDQRDPVGGEGGPEEHIRQLVDAGVEGRQDPADFLLSNFPASTREDVEVEVSRAADAIESLVLVGLDKTQSAFNS